MAIELADLHEILGVLKKRPQETRARLLIIGNADVHISPEKLEVMLFENGIKFDRNDEKITPFSLGHALGFQLTETLDINGEAVIKHDLMQPAPALLLERYDLIIDAGVLFWCFNPGIALQNIHRMLKVGGDVIHITAVSGFYGRGYYNIHPMLLEDFYAANMYSFLSAAFRSRRRLTSFSRRLLNRISCYFKSRSENMFSGHSDVFGGIYLRQTGRHSYTFGKERPLKFLITIPNDVIGVFAFRKLTYMPPVSPVLLEV